MATYTIIKEDLLNDIIKLLLYSFADAGYNYSDLTEEEQKLISEDTFNELVCLINQPMPELQLYEAKQLFEGIYSKLERTINNDIEYKLKEIDDEIKPLAHQDKLKFLMSLAESNQSRWSGGSYSTSNVFEKLMHNSALDFLRRLIR